jgi:hypothetical protein
MSPPSRTGLALFLALFATGCGGSAPESFSSVGSSIKPSASTGGAAAEAPAVKQPAAGEPVPKVQPVERKIIYTATLDVVVKDLDEARAEAERLTAAHKGFVAKSEFRTDAGYRRTGTYTIRVPVESFTALVHGLAGLGHAERNARDSQDVTEEFVDVQARLRNLRTQEDKLNELLKERRKEEKLEDVIRVSDRIFEVRQQVERVEGRLKYLETMTALSTVNLTLREVKDYKPPSAPTFGDRVGRTFGNSWDALVNFGEGVALFAVGMTPWLPILIPAVLAGVWLLRRWRRARAIPVAVRAVPVPAVGPGSPPEPGPGG